MVQWRDPKLYKFMLEPKRVSKAILEAANSPRLEIIVPFYIRVCVWIKQTIPYVIHPIVGFLFRRELNKLKNKI